MVKKRQFTVCAVGFTMMAFIALAGNFRPVAAEVVDRIVAIVNNEIVTLSELNRAVLPYRQKIEVSQNSQERKEQMIAQLEKDMLDQLVEKSLAKQEASKYGIKVTDADVDRAIENFKKTNNLDDQRLELGLANEGLTLEEYREKMKGQIRQSMLVNRAVRSKIIITDEEVTQYYEAHMDEFQGKTKYRLRNIITQSEQEMATVLEKLSSGLAFDDLARVYSVGSNAPDGGELGLFDIASFSDQIREAVQPLKKGEHTPVIQSGNTFQLIYVEEIITEGSSDLDQAREKIRSILYRTQGEKLFRQWMESLKTHAHIKLMI